MMRAPGTIDRTVHELAAERGPRTRSKLHRIALSVQAAGAAGSADEALTLICDGVDVLGGSPTVREALEHAGVDVPTVQMCLEQIDYHFELERRAEEYDKLAEISWALPVAFPNYEAG
jgi:hypothetical protein